MIKIRQATVSDLETVTQLFEKYRAFYRCSPEVESAKIFIKDRLSNKDSVIFLAVSESGAVEEALGFVQLYPLFSSVSMKKLWLLNDLYVESEARGQKVGESLMVSAIELARSSGAKGLFLETESSNRIAQGLYEKMGFVKNNNYFYSFDL